MDQPLTNEKQASSNQDSSLLADAYNRKPEEVAVSKDEKEEKHDAADVLRLAVYSPPAQQAETNEQVVAPAPKVTSKVSELGRSTAQAKEVDEVVVSSYLSSVIKEQGAPQPSPEPPAPKPQAPPSRQTSQEGLLECKGNSCNVDQQRSSGNPKAEPKVDPKPEPKVEPKAASPSPATVGVETKGQTVQPEGTGRDTKASPTESGRSATASATFSPDVAATTSQSKANEAPIVSIPALVSQVKQADVVNTGLVQQAKPAESGSASLVLTKPESVSSGLSNTQPRSAYEVTQPTGGNKPAEVVPVPAATRVEQPIAQPSTSRTSTNSNETSDKTVVSSGSKASATADSGAELAARKPEPPQQATQPVIQTLLAQGHDRGVSQAELERSFGSLIQGSGAKAAPVINNEGGNCEKNQAPKTEPKIEPRPEAKTPAPAVPEAPKQDSRAVPTASVEAPKNERTGFVVALVETLPIKPVISESVNSPTPPKVMYDAPAGAAAKPNQSEPAGNNGSPTGTRSPELAAPTAGAKHNEVIAGTIPVANGGNDGLPSKTGANNLMDGLARATGNTPDAATGKTGTPDKPLVPTSGSPEKAPLVAGDAPKAASASVPGIPAEAKPANQTSDANTTRRELSPTTIGTAGEGIARSIAKEMSEPARPATGSNTPREVVTDTKPAQASDKPVPVIEGKPNTAGSGTDALSNLMRGTAIPVKQADAKDLTQVAQNCEKKDGPAAPTAGTKPVVDPATGQPAKPTAEPTQTGSRPEGGNRTTDAQPTKTDTGKSDAGSAATRLGEQGTTRGPLENAINNGQPPKQDAPKLDSNGQPRSSETKPDTTAAPGKAGDLITGAQQNIRNNTTDATSGATSPKAGDLAGPTAPKAGENGNTGVAAVKTDASGTGKPADTTSHPTAKPDGTSTSTSKPSDLANALPVSGKSDVSPTAKPGENAVPSNGKPDATNAKPGELTSALPTAGKPDAGTSAKPGDAAPANSQKVSDTTGQPGVRTTDATTPVSANTKTDGTTVRSTEPSSAKSGEPTATTSTRGDQVSSKPGEVAGPATRGEQVTSKPGEIAPATRPADTTATKPGDTTAAIGRGAETATAKPADVVATTGREVGARSEVSTKTDANGKTESTVGKPESTVSTQAGARNESTTKGADAQHGTTAKVEGARSEANISSTRPESNVTATKNDSGQIGTRNEASNQPGAVRNEAQVGNKVDAQIATKAETQIGNKVDAQIGNKVETQIGTKVDAQIGNKVETQVGTKVDAQIGTKVDSPIGNKVETQVGTKVDAQIGTKVDAQIGTKVDAQIGTKVDAQSNRVIDAQNQPTAANRTEGNQQRTDKSDATGSDSRNVKDNASSNNTDRTQNAKIEGVRPINENGQVNTHLVNLISAAVTESGIKNEARSLLEQIKHIDGDLHVRNEEEVYYFPGLKVALRLADIIRLADCTGEDKDDAEQNNKNAQEKAKIQHRTRYTVLPGETLDSIAIDLLGDIRFVGLIVTINRSEIIFRVEDGMRVPTVMAGQVIWLPAPDELETYQKHYFTTKRSGTPARYPSISQPNINTPVWVSANGDLRTPTPSRQSRENSISRQTPISVQNSDSSPMALVLYKVRHAGNRQSISIQESQEEGAEQIIERRCYQVRLGETLQSVALRDPLMNDIRMWKLVAHINRLGLETDQYGKPLARIEKGQVLILPTEREVAEFKFLNKLGSVVNNANNDDATIVVSERNPQYSQSAQPEIQSFAPPSRPMGEPMQVEGSVSVKKLAEYCRVMVVVSADETSFAVKLQALSMANWTTIAAYESRPTGAFHTTYNRDGSFRAMALELPAAVVQQMAIEDVSRNWNLYCTRFFRDGSSAQRNKLGNALQGAM